MDGGAGTVSGVELEDGTVLPAEIVLIGIGVVPNTDLAEQLGLTVDNGIVVDANAIASDGTTVAVGDVANMPNPVPGAPQGERIRLESVNNAIEHAKVAAYSLTGRREEYAGIPWFWSNQADLKLQIAGLSLGYDRTLVRRDDERGQVLGSVLPRRSGDRGRLRQYPTGLHGGQERPRQTAEHSRRRRGRSIRSAQVDHRRPVTEATCPQGAS